MNSCIDCKFFIWGLPHKCTNDNVAPVQNDVVFGRYRKHVPCRKARKSGTLFKKSGACGPCGKFYKPAIDKSPKISDLQDGQWKPIFHAKKDGTPYLFLYADMSGAVLARYGQTVKEPSYNGWFEGLDYQDLVDISDCIACLEIPQNFKGVNI